MDHDGIRSTGSIDISMANIDDVTGGVHSSGDITLSDAAFSNAGVGVLWLVELLMLKNWSLQQELEMH